MNIRDYFFRTRKRTKSICEPLTIEDYGVQVASFASPAKWHLAHTTWFFEAFILKPYLSDYQEFHKDFNFLFNSYYNNVGDRVFRANRGNMTRPDVSQIYEYRAYVEDAVAQLLSKGGNEK
ncbi:MAG: ergothioneine biosynthesis protein EgtB, partial [Flavobacteriales bacterium]